MRSLHRTLWIFPLLALPSCALEGPGSGLRVAPSSPAADVDLYDWLQSEAVASEALRVDRAPDRVAGSLIDDEPRTKVGVTTALDLAVALSDVSTLDVAPTTLPFGAIRSDGAEGFVWSGTLDSPGVAALRLGLEDFFLPAGAELYLYDELGEVAGPYTHFGPRGDETLWTHVLRGDRVHLQIHYTGSDVDHALAVTRFTVAEVGHLDGRFLAARYGNSEEDFRAFCAFNDTCVENAACSNLPAAVQDAQDAVALMVFTSGPFQYICSGGLMADAAQTGTPHFITANHCISKGSEANSLETYFQFQTGCGGSCSLTGSAHTQGATIEATSSTSDYTLLLLSGSAPAGSQFLDQNTSEIAFSDGTPLYRISHPGGAPQAYSSHTVDTAKGTCGSWPRGSWIYSTDTFGATEGGSSGSPVVDASGLMVGQLSGGCGFNVGDVCDSVSNATVDGAFFAYQGAVAGFLGGGGCTDADGDGWCIADGDCDDADAGINPGASEICGDGVDNDCDSQIDENCNGGECAVVGDSCVEDDECCSDKCKGKPGNKSCK